MMERNIDKGQYDFHIYNFDASVVDLRKKMQQHKTKINFWRPSEHFIDTTLDLIENCHEFDWGNMMTRCEMLVYYASDLAGVKSHDVIIDAERKMRSFLEKIWGSKTDRIPTRVAA
ncbi:MAG: hypothetical protein AAFY91_06905 [Bacteroidota bacterium]